MNDLNARIYVKLELDDGQTREFDLDYGSVAISERGEVCVFDNSGRLLSADGSPLSEGVKDWLLVK